MGSWNISDLLHLLLFLLYALSTSILLYLNQFYDRLNYHHHHQSLKHFCRVISRIYVIFISKTWMLQRKGSMLLLSLCMCKAPELNHMKFGSQDISEGSNFAVFKNQHWEALSIISFSSESNWCFVNHYTEICTKFCCLWICLTCLVIMIDVNVQRYLLHLLQNYQYSHQITTFHIFSKKSYWYS